MKPLIIGFFLDLIIGDPNNPLHPVRLIGALGIKLEKILRRIMSNKLKLAGFFTWLIVIGITFSIIYGIVKISYGFNYYLGILIEGILIYFCISAKGLKYEALKVIKTLENGNIEKSRKELSYIVGRDTESLDEESITRAVIETVAENMSDGIIAPILFASIGGAPLAMAYKAVNTCDSMFGYKNDKYKDFGFISAKLDDIFNYIPARITGYLIVISAWILGLRYKESYKIYKRDRYNHSSPNSAHPEAAMAGALGIRLGGASYYFGKLVEKPTIGDSLKKIETTDLYLANSVLLISSILGLFLGVFITILIGGVI